MESGKWNQGGKNIGEGTNGAEKSENNGLRCESLGRGKSKGVKDEKYRICNEQEESLEHIWRCRVAQESLTEKKYVRTVKEMRLGEGGEKARKVLMEILNGDTIENICK